MLRHSKVAYLGLSLAILDLSCLFRNGEECAIWKKKIHILLRISTGPLCGGGCNLLNTLRPKANIKSFLTTRAWAVLPKYTLSKFYRAKCQHLEHWHLVFCPSLPAYYSPKINVTNKNWNETKLMKIYLTNFNCLFIWCSFLPNFGESGSRLEVLLSKFWYLSWIVVESWVYKFYMASKSSYYLSLTQNWS